MQANTKYINSTKGMFSIVANGGPNVANGGPSVANGGPTPRMHTLTSPGGASIWSEGASMLL